MSIPYSLSAVALGFILFSILGFMRGTWKRIRLGQTPTSHCSAIVAMVPCRPGQAGIRKRAECSTLELDSCFRALLRAMNNGFELS